MIFVCVVGLLEVVKAMQELGVSPDIETLSQYIVPAFPSISEAQQALKVIHNSVCECVYVYMWQVGKKTC